MSVHRSLLPGALLVLALALLSFTPAPAQAPANRTEEIANLEKQIQEMKLKLEALKKAAPATPAGPTLPAEWVKALSWRCIGPASMGGRIVALSVYPADPTIYWVATASGGLLKTTNAGVTFEHQFDREATVSIGDVAVAPSNPNIVWVGTGENNPRNSVSYGDGVYRSVDGGKTWTNVGLRKSFQIGKIVVHPTNPDVAYVGVLGRLYGPSEERGLFKTTDGGKTWSRILFVDDRTGVIDMQMHPTQPDTLVVATWERLRDGFDSHAGALANQMFGVRTTTTKIDPPLENGYDAYDPIKKWGKGGGLWKTTDGGKTFRKLAKGLPTCETGRIGLDFSRKNPNTLFAIIDTAKIGMGRVPGYLGVTPENAGKDSGVKITGVTQRSPAEKAGLKVGDILTTIDGKALKTRDELGSAVQTRGPGDRIKVGLLRDGKAQTLEVTLSEPPDLAGSRQVQLDFQVEVAMGGLRVKQVEAGGAAAKAGLQVGDVITRVDKEAATRMGQLVGALRATGPGNKLALTIQREKATKQVELIPAQASSSTPPRPYGYMYGGQLVNVQDRQGSEGHEYGGVYKSTDVGETWTRINSVNPRPMYFSQVRVDPSDENLVYVLGVGMYRSEDGGKTFKQEGDAGVHPDHHAMWINPRDGRHIILGTDGGTYVTYNRCKHWDYLNNMAVGQFYHVCVDSRKPYRVYGGMQDNGSWGGISMALDGRGPINSDWVLVQGGDGFVCQVDPSDPDIVYSESQEGNMFRTNLRTGERKSIKPRTPAGQPAYRFNWNSPMVVSQHNPSIFYCAGNHVFRSTKRGEDPRRISPELTANAKASAVSLAESPRNPDVLWVGTDDGQLWNTRDGGTTWTNLTTKVGLPRPYWVATIEPSRFVEGRCYVCFDTHRNDNDEPHVYVTEDFGQTWKPIRGNLPTGSSRVLREDLYNPEVLYLGTEFAVWASIDRGASWTRINSNLPTVAVHELAQHPTAGELVAATHGRSIWILDVSALRQLKPATVRSNATLYAPPTAVRWRRELTRGTIYGSGHREYFADNPQPGAAIYYSLAKKVGDLRLEVQDVTGKRLTTLPVKNEPGLHRVMWNLRGTPTPLGLDLLLPGGLLNSMNRQQQAAPPGQYRIVLTVDKSEQIQPLKLENDPSLPPQTILADTPETPRKTHPTEY
ncbi:MAG: PDZ domain-containing protein [Gemmataceae bacterium]